MDTVEQVTWKLIPSPIVREKKLPGKYFEFSIVLRQICCTEDEAFVIY